MRYIGHASSALKATASRLATMGPLLAPREPLLGYQQRAAVMLVKLATLLYVLIDPDVPDSSFSAWLLPGFLLHFLGAQQQRPRTALICQQQAHVAVKGIESSAAACFKSEGSILLLSSTPNLTIPSQQGKTAAAAAANETSPASRDDPQPCLVRHTAHKTSGPCGGRAYSSSLLRALVTIKVRQPAGVELKDIGKPGSSFWYAVQAGFGGKNLSRMHTLGTTYRACTLTSACARDSSVGM